MTLCRGALGAVSWRATQTAPWLQAECSILMSQLAQGKVAVISKINKLVRELNNSAKIPMTLFPVKDWNLVAWADAAWAVRADGTSQGGYLVGLVEKDFTRGKWVQLPRWHGAAGNFIGQQEAVLQPKYNQ